MSPTTEPPRAGVLVLGGLALCMLLSSLGMSIASVALPDLTVAFHAPLSSVQWVLLAYMLTMTVTIVAAGRIGDLFGRRRILLAGLYIFTIGAIAGALATQFWVLIAGRAIQGLGAAIMMSHTMAAARETVPDRRIGAAMGLLGTMSAIGTALGPSLGGFLIAGFGWHAIFWVLVPLGLVAIGFVQTGLPRPAPGASPQKRDLDMPGIVLLGVALAGFALATSRGGGFTPALLIVAVTSAGVFVLRQRQAPAPLVPLSALRDTTLAVSLIMNLLVAIVMMSTLIAAPFYLGQGLGLGAAMVGLAMSTGPIASALTGLPAGRLVDRFGPDVMTAIGLMQMLLGAIGLIVLPASFGLIGYIVAATLMPPGYQAFLAANNARIMSRTRPDERGLMSSLLNLSRNLGLLTGTSLMSFVFAAGLPGLAAMPLSVTARFQITFGLAAALVVAALGCSAFAWLNKSSSDRYRPEP